MNGVQASEKVENLL